MGSEELTVGGDEEEDEGGSSSAWKRSGMSVPWLIENKNEKIDKQSDPFA